MFIKDLDNSYTVNMKDVEIFSDLRVSMYKGYWDKLNTAKIKGLDYVWPFIGQYENIKKSKLNKIKI